MDKMILPAKLENLDELTGFIEEKLEEHGASMKVNMQVQLSAEEIFANIASYAYPDIPEESRNDSEGMAEVRLEFVENLVRITFLDSGVPYDPLLREDPDIKKDAEERQIGGLGIFMVKKSMDKVSYEYVNGQNCLTIEKAL